MSDWVMARVFTLGAAGAFAADFKSVAVLFALSAICSLADFLYDVIKRTK